MPSSLISMTRITSGSAILGFRGSSNDTKPTGDFIGNYSTFEEVDTGKTYYYDEGEWKVMANSHGGGGSSLPANFPAESVGNAGKFIGFDNSGDYAALDAPSSGSGIYEVNVEIDDGTGSITSDKTFGEVAEAHFAGKVVRCVMKSGNNYLFSSTIINVDSASFSGSGQIGIAVCVGADIRLLTGDPTDNFGFSETQ